MAYKIATTFHYLKGDFWRERVRILDLPYIPPGPNHTLLDEVRWFLQVIKASQTDEILLLNCSTGRFYPDLLACVMIGLLPYRLRPMIVLAGAMYNPNKGLRHLIEQAVMRLANRAIHRYAVWSTEEMDELPRLWKIDRNKLRRCNYFYTFKPEELSSPEPPIEPYIFAGGNSQRDYEPLIQAARLMPRHQFIFATNQLLDRNDLPPNVIARPVPQADYVRLMRAAAAVVVPLRQNISRSAGQQTYLNSMLLRKPTIVNDAYGVKDIIRHGKTALIVSGTPESYVDAIQWVIDPANRAALCKMVDTAQREVRETYTYENHLRNLLAIIDEAIADPEIRSRSKLGRKDA